MEVKKTDKANLEKNRGLFLQIGYVFVLGIVLLAFEWGTRPSGIDSLGQLQDLDLEEEIIPITRQNTPPPPPPPPPQSTDIINIVEDDVEIEDELILDDTEADQDTEIEIVEFDDEEEIDEDEIFFVVEDMPLFNGQEKSAFRTYIQKNLNYPEIAKENGVSGKVYVQFDISATGEVKNIVIIRSVDPSLDREAIRVVKSSPRWTPGKQRGRPVKVRFTFPISFQLQ
jgi:protein TonB